LRVACLTATFENRGKKKKKGKKNRKRFDSFFALLGERGEGEGEPVTVLAPRGGRGGRKKVRGKKKKMLELASLAIRPQEGKDKGRGVLELHFSFANEGGGEKGGKKEKRKKRGGVQTNYGDFLTQGHVGKAL